MRTDIQQRLAESFETALNMSDGIARVASLDDDDNESLFSSRFSCPSCGYSIPELEPRMFSFNNPAGACGTCDGLGIKQFVDPHRIVAHPELILSAGAVLGWDRRNAYYFQLMKSLAAHYDFDLEIPFENLSEDVKKIVLYGSGRTKIDFNYLSDRGRSVKRSHALEGVIPNMQRRYHETESNSVREELAKYHTVRACHDCNGARLNEASLHVFVEQTNLPSVTEMPVGEVKAFFDQLVLPGKRGEIAAKIVAEIAERLAFLVNVGLDYLTLARSADTLSGGEAQRIRLASQIGAGLVGVMYILDEPSIGLHQRDNDRLLATLTRLRDLGNSVIVVEHDEDAIRSADYVLDIGPGAGVHGGEIVAHGAPEYIMNAEASLTGQYLSGRRKIDVPKHRQAYD